MRSGVSRVVSEERVQKIEASRIFLDIERAQGDLDSTAIQLSCVSGGDPEESFNEFIYPDEDIQSYSSSKVHKVKKSKNGLLVNGLPTVSSTLKAGMEKFIDYLKQVSSFLLRNGNENHKTSYDSPSCVF